jgi:hypothetical protein
VQTIPHAENEYDVSRGVMFVRGRFVVNPVAVVKENDRESEVVHGGAAPAKAFPW